jgi:hypothetical protein
VLALTASQALCDKWPETVDKPYTPPSSVTAPVAFTFVTSPSNHPQRPPRRLDDVLPPLTPTVEAGPSRNVLSELTTEEYRPQRPK